MQVNPELNFRRVRFTRLLKEQLIPNCLYLLPIILRIQAFHELFIKKRFMLQGG